jgi:hypothetical protein
MRRATLLTFLVTLSGCGMATHLRPAPPGQLQVEGSLGGPKPSTWPHPLPDVTAGVRYGLLPRWDVGAHLDPWFFAIGGLLVDAETNVLVLEQWSALPNVCLGARGTLGINKDGLGLSADLNATLSWALSPRWTLFGSVTGHALPTAANPVDLYGSAGIRFQFGRAGVQVEGRWYDADHWLWGSRAVNAYTDIAGDRPWGALVGLDYRYGGPPEEGDP